MKALALGLALVTLPALAQPADAPVRQVIKAGQPAPQDGCFLSDRACTDAGKQLAVLRAENAELRASLRDSPGTLFVVGALVLGLVGGAVGASLALRR